MPAVPVPADVVRGLRAGVLRPGQSARELVYEGDDAPGTLHAAVLDGDRPVAAATVMRDPYPPDPGERDWRIRGMATLPAFRGRGLGAELLALCQEHAVRGGGRRLWCNARVPAAGFYERAGMARAGGVFEIPGIGPHVLMCKRLAGEG